MSLNLESLLSGQSINLEIFFPEKDEKVNLIDILNSTINTLESNPQNEMGIADFQFQINKFSSESTSVSNTMSHTRDPMYPGLGDEDLTTFENNLNINPSIAKGVLQGEVAATQFDSDFPILGSFGAIPCVIISMYDRVNKKCSLAHIDASSNYLEAYNSLKNLLGVTENDIEIEMATLQIKNNETLEVLKNLFSVEKNISLIKIHQSSSMGIDSRTGNTFNIKNHFSLDLGNDYESRGDQRGRQALSRNALALNEIYNGIKKQ